MGEETWKRTQKKKSRQGRRKAKRKRRKRIRTTIRRRIRRKTRPPVKRNLSVNTRRSLTHSGVKSLRNHMGSANNYGMMQVPVWRQ